MVRKLGKKWTTLHRLIYFAAGLAVLHFIWSQKKDIRTPLLYLGVLAVLLLARLVLRPRAGRSKPRVIESRA
jgi:sulfoxide reductase heme-binding subunit YedZ